MRGTWITAVITAVIRRLRHILLFPTATLVLRLGILGRNGRCRLPLVGIRDIALKGTIAGG
jgi:hypothetical protein